MDKDNKRTEFDNTDKKLHISDVMHSDYQQQLFHEIVGMKHRMQGLAGFVQNDFDRMLEDGKLIVELANQILPV